MDALAESRAKLNQEFALNISLAFRGIRKSILKRIDHKYSNRVTENLRYIISEDEVAKCRHQNLMRKLISNNSEELKALLYRYQNLSMLNILREASSASKKIRETGKKLAKLLTKYNKLTAKSSKKKGKSSELFGQLKLEWQMYTEDVKAHSALLACLDEKLEESRTLGLKTRKLAFKLTEKTKKLIRHVWGGSVYSSESNSSSSSEDECQEITKPPELEQTIEPRNSKVRKLKKVSKGLVQRITKPGIFRIQPWPLEDRDGPGINPTRHVNYGIFLASTWMTGNPDSTPSVDLSASRANVPHPSPSILTVHSISSSEKGEGTVDAVALCEQKTPDSTPPGGNQPNDSSKSPECVTQKTPLKKKTDVYLRVIKKFKSTDKTELSLKVGQIVKQKRPTDDRGFAYGWIKSKVGLKQYGFFPLSHMVEKGEVKK